jgi:hypothetical protein
MSVLHGEIESSFADGEHALSDLNIEISEKRDCCVKIVGLSFIGL